MDKIIEFFLEINFHFNNIYFDIIMWQRWYVFHNYNKWVVTK